jgi:periplasmic protein TonB
MSPPEASFKAEAAHRAIERRAPAAPARLRAAVALLCAGVIHAGILAFLLFENRFAPAAPQTVEIPVEIIAEPPPQPKPDDSPAAKTDPSPPAKPPDLEPAFDAPRQTNDEKVKQEAPDEASKAPPAPSPIQQPTPGVAPAGPTGPTQEGELHQGEKAAEPALDKPDAEITRKFELDHDKTEQPQARAEAKAQPETAAKTGGDPFPPWSAYQQFPAFEKSLPELEVGSAAEFAPVAGGNAKATYLTIVYGMVMSHMRSQLAHRVNGAKIEGVIVFNIDGAGALLQKSIIRPSGLRELDVAALAAVAQAATFPAPPGGAPIGLRFTYGAK